MSHGGPLRIKSFSILRWYAGLKQSRSREAISVMLGDIWEEAKKTTAGCSMRLAEDTGNAENKGAKEKTIIHR